MEHRRTYRLDDDGVTVFANPIVTHHPNGSSSITIGFPICKICEWVSPPKAVVQILNLGEQAVALVDVLERLLKEIDDPNCESLGSLHIVQEARTAIAKAKEGP